MRKRDIIRRRHILGRIILFLTLAIAMTVNVMAFPAPEEGEDPENLYNRQVDWINKNPSAFNPSDQGQVNVFKRAYTEGKISQEGIAVGRYLNSQQLIKDDDLQMADSYLTAQSSLSQDDRLTARKYLTKVTDKNFDLSQGEVLLKKDPDGTFISDSRGEKHYVSDLSDMQGLVSVYSTKEGELILDFSRKGNLHLSGTTIRQEGENLILKDGTVIDLGDNPRKEISIGSSSGLQTYSCEEGCNINIDGTRISLGKGGTFEAKGEEAELKGGTIYLHDGPIDALEGSVIHGNAKMTLRERSIDLSEPVILEGDSHIRMDGRMQAARPLDGQVAFCMGCTDLDHMLAQGKIEGYVAWDNEGRNAKARGKGIYSLGEDNIYVGNNIDSLVSYKENMGFNDIKAEFIGNPVENGEVGYIMSGNELITLEKVYSDGKDHGIHVQRNRFSRAPPQDPTLIDALKFYSGNSMDSERFSSREASLLLYNEIGFNLFKDGKIDLKGNSRLTDIDLLEKNIFQGVDRKYPQVNQYAPDSPNRIVWEEMRDIERTKKLNDYFSGLDLESAKDIRTHMLDEYRTPTYLHTDAIKYDGDERVTGFENFYYQAGGNWVVEQTKTHNTIHYQIFLTTKYEQVSLDEIRSYHPAIPDSELAYRKAEVAALYRSLQNTESQMHEKASLLEYYDDAILTRRLREFAFGSESEVYNELSDFGEIYSATKEIISERISGRSMQEIRTRAEYDYMNSIDEETVAKARAVLNAFNEPLVRSSANVELISRGRGIWTDSEGKTYQLSDPDERIDALLRNGYQTASDYHKTDRYSDASTQYTLVLTAEYGVERAYSIMRSIESMPIDDGFSTGTILVDGIGYTITEDLKGIDLKIIEDIKRNTVTSKRDSTYRFFTELGIDMLEPADILFNLATGLGQGKAIMTGVKIGAEKAIVAGSAKAMLGVIGKAGVESASLAVLGIGAGSKLTTLAEQKDALTKLNSALELAKVNPSQVDELRQAIRYAEEVGVDRQAIAKAQGWKGVSEEKAGDMLSADLSYIRAADSYIETDPAKAAVLRKRSDKIHDDYWDGIMLKADPELADEFFMGTINRGTSYDRSIAVDEAGDLFLTKRLGSPNRPDTEAMAVEEIASDFYRELGFEGPRARVMENKEGIISPALSGEGDRVVVSKIIPGREYSWDEISVGQIANLNELKETSVISVLIGDRDRAGNIILKQGLDGINAHQIDFGGGAFSIPSLERSMYGLIDNSLPETVMKKSTYNDFLPAIDRIESTFTDSYLRSLAEDKVKRGVLNQKEADDLVMVLGERRNFLRHHYQQYFGVSP